MHLDIMTFNIRYLNKHDEEHSWNRRNYAVIQTIKSHNHDIFGIQEGLVEQVKYISDHLPVFRWVGVGREDGKEKGEFAAIFYSSKKFSLIDNGTFWLSKYADKVGSNTRGNACVRICTWATLQGKSSGEKIFVLNAHLDHRNKRARKRKINQAKNRSFVPD